MEESQSRRQFSAMVAGPDASVDLAAAALFIACEEYPDLDVQAYLERLDSMAADLRARLEDTRPGAAVPALNRLLFRDHGFRGNVQDYYDPRNSFLNDVMDRRTGIPISLSTVYMEVGRRAGLLVDGVGLPGHFIVRVGGAAGDGPAMLVDPFHNGVVLTRADCQRRLDRIYDGKLKLATAMLGRCDQKAILGRMLRNLKGIYTRRGDHRRALNVVELLLLVHPSSGEDVRDRGLLFAALDCYGLAARDLEAYVTRSPAAADAEELRGRAAELKRLAARLN